MSKNILIVDDERSIRNTLRDILGFEGYTITEAEDGSKAIEIVKSKLPLDCVLCDIKMPKIDGIEVLEVITEVRPNIPVIMISGHNDIDAAVEAVKKGAFDYISKPPDLNKLLLSVKSALELATTSATTESKVKDTDKKKQITSTSGHAIHIFSESESMKKVLNMIDRVAFTDARVLILGPNGVGKEVMAKRIHAQSKRKNAPLITLNCAAIPSELIESELFGHEKGAFTNAIKQHIGKFEQAHTGTLFLDEIGDMSLSAQAKVLRAMQEGIITRIGSNKDIKVDVRIIAATNKDLEKEIKLGNFREDLYHRLSVVVVKIPSLNDRREDIEHLVNHFIESISAEYGKNTLFIDNKAMNKLINHNWTGNIRELKNVIERLIIFCEDAINEHDVEQYI